MFHFTACNNIKKSKLIISKFNINHAILFPNVTILFYTCLFPSKTKFKFKMRFKFGIKV